MVNFRLSDRLLLIAVVFFILFVAEINARGRRGGGSRGRGGSKGGGGGGFSINGGVYYAIGVGILVAVGMIIYVTYWLFKKWKKRGETARAMRRGNLQRSGITQRVSPAAKTGATPSGVVATPTPRLNPPLPGSTQTDYRPWSTESCRNS